MLSNHVGLTRGSLNPLYKQEPHPLVHLVCSRENSWRAVTTGTSLPLAQYMDV